MAKKKDSAKLKLIKKREHSKESKVVMTSKKEKSEKKNSERVEVLTEGRQGVALMPGRTNAVQKGIASIASR